MLFVFNEIIELRVIEKTRTTSYDITNVGTTRVRGRVNNLRTITDITEGVEGARARNTRPATKR